MKWGNLRLINHPIIWQIRSWDEIKKTTRKTQGKMFSFRSIKSRFLRDTWECECGVEFCLLVWDFVVSLMKARNDWHLYKWREKHKSALIVLSLSATEVWRTSLIFVIKKKKKFFWLNLLKENFKYCDNFHRLFI